VLLGAVGLDDIVRPTSTPNLFLAPAGETLVGLDITLAGAMAREQILRNCLREARSAREFDVVLIDNPPNISLATVNSVVASSHYLVPVSCETLPMYGIRLLFENIEKIKRILNPDLALLGVVLTLYDRREGITEKVEAALRRQLGAAVFDTVIRVNTKYKSTPLSRQTIFEYEQDARGKGSEDYRHLTDEVLVRLREGGALLLPPAGETPADSSAGQPAMETSVYAQR
jgi:chromosome partitioning protein